MSKRNIFKNKSTRWKPEPTLANARSYAIYLLARQMYTCGIIEDKLKQKGYSANDTEAVVKEMKELGYLNDANYADVYFRNLSGRGVYGYYGIKGRLENKKLSESEISRVMSDMDDERELDIAKAFINSRGRGFAWSRDQKEKQKLIRMMQNRGFRWNSIAAVLKELK